MAARVPSSTYRIQFSPDFSFGDAESLVPYLDALGIGDLYASPSMAARPGSRHGYDVADASRFSSELGGEAAFRSLCEALNGRGMGLMLDIVPNHMAATMANPWWADLLENGRASRYARFFDIDWEPPVGRGTESEKILLPVLGQVYGVTLEAGEIWIGIGENGLAVRYYEFALPVAARSYGSILGDCFDAVPDPEEGYLAQRRALADALAAHARGGGDPEASRERLHAALWSLYRGHPRFRACVDARLRSVNGSRGDASSFVELDSILEEQAYRLSYWRRAADRINYRRFFDISDLVGVRVEEEEVFRQRHELILRLVREGLIHGLRIDHIDGLFDPEEYLRRLQREAAPRWNGDPRKLDFYVVVEKITAPHEELPESFATHGTSGYDFLNVLNSLFVDPQGLRELDRAYRRLSGIERDFEEIAYEGKRLVADELFWGDIRRLGDHLIALARADRYARDAHARQLSRALVEVTSRLGVYRTYIRDEEVRAEDRRFIESAFERARRTPFISRRAIEFVRRVLLLEPPPYAADQKKAWLDFVMRWQQLTGRVTAKGVEDTAFYVHNRLISMNEVGGEPTDDVTRSLPRFHQYNRDTVARWPARLNATSTHDTKRSEDVRARINVLSEIPDRWKRAVERWMRVNRPKKRLVDGQPVPDANEELLLYQTLIGMWPIDRTAERHLPSRVESFVIKAAREAKAHSRWTRPDEEYESALVDFASALARRSRLGWFRDFAKLQEYVAHFGAINSLSQLVLKAMSPGVPDFYQGTEVWNLTIVDPDNRRTVDYERRWAMLERLETVNDPSKLLAKWQDGMVKLFVTQRLLRLRRERDALFRGGDYTPLRTLGLRAENVVAFVRSHEGQRVAVAVPRMVTRLVAPPKFPVGRRVWAETRIQLPPGDWKNTFTGERVEDGRAAEVFATFPVAVLVDG